MLTQAPVSASDEPDDGIGLMIKPDALRLISIVIEKTMQLP